MNSSIIASKSMLLFRHFGLGALLILAASAILLFSDPRRNTRANAGDGPKKIALINYASIPTLTDGEAGIIDGLKEKGYVDGKTMILTRYNAEGDRATALMIAKEATGGDFDMIITLSTAALQAVATSNINTQRTHIFTLTTDPWHAGVGISAKDPAQHPPYMTGYGSLQPVAALFELARQANPNLSTVGVVWNPAESNSESSTLLARETCKKLNIKLIEATVDSSAGVLEAVKAVISQNVDAIWAGGDVTVSAAMDTMIATATSHGIPVFTNMPVDSRRGALFCLGSNHFNVGSEAGFLAARVLNGESPAHIPVRNFVPEILAINLASWKSFQGNWTIGRNWKERATIIIDENGRSEK